MQPRLSPWTGDPWSHGHCTRPRGCDISVIMIKGTNKQYLYMASHLIDLIWSSNTTLRHSKLSSITSPHITWYRDNPIIFPLPTTHTHPSRDHHAMQHTTQHTTPHHTSHWGSTLQGPCPEDACPHYLHVRSDTMATVPLSKGPRRQRRPLHNGQTVTLLVSSTMV